jgi:Zn finger protein HypA/HybF involved in hydrogenase expression
MHEVAAIQGVISSIVEAMHQAGGERVTSVHLLLGASGHLSEETARQHFAMLAVGTPVEHAELAIDWAPANYQCFSCGQRFEVTEIVEPVSCPACDGIALEVAHQEVCYACEIEVVTSTSDPVDTSSAVAKGA